MTPRRPDVSDYFTQKAELRQEPPDAGFVPWRPRFLRKE
jgi:hypothetical protein